MPFDTKQHSLNSSLRENIIEHLFIGEMLRCLWQKGITDCEILRSEFDGYGYDLVVSRGKITRHVQLKSGIRPPTRVPINLSLAEKQSGVVLYLVLNDVLEVTSYFWIGDEAGKPLPDLTGLETAKRTTRNVKGVQPERLRHRVVRKQDFIELTSLEMVIERLIGNS